MTLNAVAIGGGDGGHGLDPAPGGVWITDGDALDAMLSRLNRGVLGGGAKVAPDVDFARQGVLVVRMGRKPTGGYGLALDAAQSRIQDRTAWVTVVWDEPGPGEMVTQAITHPYLMIRMDRGDFDRIAVADQDGRTRIRMDLPARQ